MNLFAVLIKAIKEVILSFTPNRSLCEGMVKYDFKVDSQRNNLMQICFSAIANWPLIFFFLMAYCIHNFQILSVSNYFAESIRFYFLDGRLNNIFIIFFSFFVIEWILRKEFLLISLLFYFLISANIHVNLALAALIGVYFSRACYLWWLHLELVEQTRAIWKWVTSLQLCSVFLASLVSLILLDYLGKIYFFAGIESFRRGFFYLCIFFLFQILNLSILAIWGHFYFKIKKDPSYISTYYSTATWILRFKMSLYLKTQLVRKVDQDIKNHYVYLEQLKELKDQSLGLKMSNIEVIIAKELTFLHMASSRLTID